MGKSSKKADKVDAMGKSSNKADKVDEASPKEVETQVEPFLSPIANPMADKKLRKKCLKLVSKATKAKTVRRGVKEVVKALRKGTKGVCVLAGNISPMDVISHIPILCEDNEVPYLFVPTKEELGAAGSTRRPTSCVLITKDSEDFDALAKAVSKIQPVF